MKFISFLAFLFCALLPQQSYAQTIDNTLPLKEWSKLPIIYEGRLKPIDSAAAILINKITQKNNIDGLNANEWLAEIVFNPSQAMERPIFNVRNIPTFKDLENKTVDYVTLTQLMSTKSKTINQLLEIDEKNWSKDQQALMNLHQNYILFTQLLRSLSALIPLIADLDFIKDTDKKNFNYLDLKRNEEFLQRETKKIIDEKGANPKSYSEEELKISAASFQLNLIEQSSQNNILFRIIPNFQSAPINWQAPWDIILSGQSSPKSAKYIDLWSQMASAYIDQDAKAWRTTISEIQTQLNEDGIKSLSDEYWFNQLNLKEVSTFSYGVVLLLLLIGTILKTQRDRLLKSAVAVLGIATLSHIALITFRIIILERPPVGTLYESMLFVSLISSIVMFLLAIRKTQERKFLYTLTGGLLGFIIMGVSYGIKDVNSMPTLVAVLNTNFWLAFHVLCITIGYAICFICGLFAHYYLFLKIRNNNHEHLKPLFKIILVTSVFALLFTAVGTILGGIWADQSWGRFWGWDPKENGALLIVLWLVWLLHSRVSGQLRDVGFMTGMAFINIIVVLAWFGVNLLNVGLHSYGFIEGVALSIALFCAIETMIIVALSFTAFQKQKIA